MKKNPCVLNTQTQKRVCFPKPKSTCSRFGPCRFVETTKRRGILHASFHETWEPKIFYVGNLWGFERAKPFQFQGKKAFRKGKMIDDCSS